MVNNASPMGKKFGNRCRSIGGGRKPKCQEIEQELLSWIDEKRAKALHVSRKMIKERALIIFEEKKVSEIWDKIPEKIEPLPEEIDLDEDLFDDDMSDED